MPTSGNVRADSPLRHSLQPGERLTVTAGSVSNGRLGRSNDGAAPTSFQYIAAGQTIKIGPFPFATVHLIESFAGTLSYLIEAPVYGYAMNLGAIRPFTGNLTLRTEDNGKLLRCDDASPVTVTVPPDLPEGFNVGLAVWAAGSLTVAAGSGATKRSSTSALLTQYGGGSLLVMKNADNASAEFVLGGDFA